MRTIATIALTVYLLSSPTTGAIIQFDRDRPVAARNSLPISSPSSSDSSSSEPPAAIRKPSQLQFKWSSSRNPSSPPPSAPGSAHPLKLVLSSNQDIHDPNPDSDSYYDLDATHHHHGVSVDTAQIRSALQRLPSVRNPLPDLGVRKGLSRGTQRLGKTLVSLRGGRRADGSMSRMEEEEELDRAEARRERGQKRNDWWRGLAARTRMVNRRRPGAQRGMEVVLNDDDEDDDDNREGGEEGDEWWNAWQNGEEDGGAVELDLEVSEALDDLKNEDGASLSGTGRLQSLKGAGKAWRNSWYRAAKGMPVAMARDD